MSQAIGNQAFIIGRGDQGPFSLAALLLGMDEFLLQLALADTSAGDAAPGEHAAQLHRLLEFSLEVVKRYAVAQIEQGAHMTSIGESLSGPDVCSPKMYREYEWGYARDLVTALRQKDILLAYHICGNATAIVPDMVETGAAVLELDYKVDLARVKQSHARTRHHPGTNRPQRRVGAGYAGTGRRQSAGSDCYPRRGRRPDSRPWLCPAPDHAPRKRACSDRGGKTLRNLFLIENVSN